MTRRWRALAALEERPFRLLWLSRTFSSIGDVLVPIALVFAVLSISNSPSAVGVTLAAVLVPKALLTVVAGVWTDRLGQKSVMLASDGVRGGAQGAIAALLLTGQAQLWHVIVLSGIYGAAAAFYEPASTGLVPQTVTAERLQQANALLIFSRSTLAVAGPLVSGVLVATANPGWLFAVDAGTFAASAYFLALLEVRAPAAERAAFMSDLAEGWKELTKRTWVWTGIIYFSVWNFGLSGYIVLGPVVAKRDLGGSEAWGLVFSGSAVGAIIGSTISLRFKPVHPLRTGFLLLGLTGPLPAALLVRPFPTIAIAAAATLMVTAIALLNTLWTTSLQQHVPRRALSRVSAWDSMGSFVLPTVGLAIVGSIAELIGIDATLLVSVGILTAASFATLLVPSVRNLRRIELPKAGPHARPAAPDRSAVVS